MADEIESEEDLGRLGDEKIALGNGLLEALDELDHIDGVAKIKRKIASEISSLQKVSHNYRKKTLAFVCYIRRSSSPSCSTGDLIKALRYQPHSLQ